MTAALYARVSTSDQTCENQLLELRRYCQARGWRVWREYVDSGVSGAKDSRPALDALLLDSRRRHFGTVVCWRLDRLGRNLHHPIGLLEELQAVGVSFVSLGEGIDLGTPAGRLQLHILAALAEFERSRIQERMKASGRRLGRPVEAIPVEKLSAVAGLSVREGAKRLGVPRSTLQRWRTSSNTAGHR